MCRIALAFCLQGEIRPVIYSRVENALKLMVKGGPDSTNIWSDSNVVIGHNRLSIIDTDERSNQPMISQCGNFIIAFNGEVYNHEKIKADLESQGKTFRTTSDTEVILQGFIEKGYEIFDLLEGMFAITIYCIRTKQIVIARDALGIKPLYFGQKESQIFITSEVKAMKSMGDFTLSKDWELLFDIFGHIPSPHTIFEDVRQLDKGVVYVVDQDGLSIVSKMTKKSKHDLTLSGVFDLVISEHLRCDVSSTVFFSAGVDSTILTAKLDQLRIRHSLSSLLFKTSNSDLSPIQRYVESHNLKEINTWEPSENELRNNWLAFLEAMDQPTIDGFNTFLISSFISKKGIKMAVSGVGSDEIFGGYPSEFRVRLIPFLRRCMKIRYLNHILIKIRPRLDWLTIDSVVADFLFLRGMTSLGQIKERYNKPHRWIEDILNECKKGCESDFTYYQDFLEFEFYCNNQLLKDTDVFGMANSVEIRTPFVDRRILYSSQRLRRVMFKKYNKRELIKHIGVRIPSYIYARAKQGFYIPHKPSKTSKMNEIKNNIKQKYGEE